MEVNRAATAFASLFGAALLKGGGGDHAKYHAKMERLAKRKLDEWNKDPQSQPVEDDPAPAPSSALAPFPTKSPFPKADAPTATPFPGKPSAKKGKAKKPTPAEPEPFGDNSDPDMPRPVDVKHLSKFTSKTHKVLSGIHANGEHAIASDGHRIAMVPTSDRGHIKHKDGGEVLRHPLVVGGAYSNNGKVEKYPDLKKILPTPEQVTSTHSFDTVALHGLSEAAKKSANGKTPFVDFHRDESGAAHARIAGDGAPDMQVHAMTHKAPTVENLKPPGGRGLDGRVVRVNARYLSDAMSGGSGPTTLHLTHAAGPMDFHRADGQRHVIMPTGA